MLKKRKITSFAAAFKLFINRQLITANFYYFCRNCLIIYHELS